MLGRIVTLGPAFAAALAAVAMAEPAPVPVVQTPPAERAMPAVMHRAVVAFGHVPCGRPVIALGDFVDADVAAGADPVGCRIYFNAAIFSRMSKEMICTLLLHEYGHLAGRADSDDPTSVMFRFYVGPDRRCRDTGS